MEEEETFVELVGTLAAELTAGSSDGCNDGDM